MMKKMYVQSARLSMIRIALIFTPEDNGTFDDLFEYVQYSTLSQRWVLLLNVASLL
jgi:hypothetical protein